MAPKKKNKYVGCNKMFFLIKDYLKHAEKEST